MSNVMLSIDQFAEARKVSTKTVRRWIAAGRIQGATQVGGKWLLPSDATVQDTIPGVVALAREGAPVHPWAPSALAVNAPQLATPTVADALAPLPVMVPLDTAARILGVSEYAMRRNAEYFQLVRMGDRGAYVMPKARIRDLEG